MSTADILDRALEEGGSGRPAPASVRALLDVAAEVAEALASTRLTEAERQRIYARSLAMLEQAMLAQRQGWQRALRLDRRAPVLVGGAAAFTLGAAAIAWAVLHQRRSHPSPAG